LSAMPQFGTDQTFGLWYFQKSRPAVAEAIDAGISTFIVDWEHRGKAQRQSGRDTEVNADTPADLKAVSNMPGAAAVCRINGPDHDAAGDVELAIEGGASLILLPMVRRVAEVEAFLRQLRGRAAGGILIETQAALHCVQELARLPLSAVYIGLNDLSIELGNGSLFTAIVDGTVERVADELKAAGIPFGFGGVTLVDRGHPVPFRLLMAEMARHGATFSFARRAFRRDIAGRCLPEEVALIHELWRRLKRRPPREVEADRASFEAVARRCEL